MRKQKVKTQTEPNLNKSKNFLFDDIYILFKIVSVADNHELLVLAADFFS